MVMTLPFATVAVLAGVSTSCGPSGIPARLSTPDTERANVRTWVTLPSTETVTVLSSMTYPVVPASNAAVTAP
jgi:hypothetical protein